MKKQLLIFATLVASCCTLYAQNGNVGIGTTTPGTKLQVVGGIAGGTSFGIAGTAPLNNIYLELIGNTTLPAPMANGQIMFIKNNAGANITLTKGYSGGMFDAYSATDVASMVIKPYGHKMFIGYIQGAAIGWIAQLSVDPSMLPDSSWNIKGNLGTNSAANFLGTRDNASLSFRTNNLQRIYVDSATGFVGVNTNTPGVNAHILNKGNGGASVGASNTTNMALRLENATNGQAVIQDFQARDASAAVKQVSMGINPAAGPGYFVLTRPGASDMLLDISNGNVGIGGAAPTATLDINGTQRIRNTPVITPGLGATISVPVFRDANGNIVTLSPPGHEDVMSGRVTAAPGASTLIIANIPNGSIHKLTVVVSNGCTNMALADFWVIANSTGGSAMQGRDGFCSLNGTAPPTFTETQTSSAAAFGGVPTCQDGGNTANLDFTMYIVNSGNGTFQINIVNNGNVNRDYSATLERVGAF